MSKWSAATSQPIGRRGFLVTGAAAGASATLGGSRTGLTSTRPTSAGPTSSDWAALRKHLSAFVHRDALFLAQYSTSWTYNPS